MNWKKIFIFSISLTFIGIYFVWTTQYISPKKYTSPRQDLGEAAVNVVRVIDGDTIEVKIGNKYESVRFLGINAPETVDPRKPVECFGIEASEKLKELLSNKEVLLKSDSTQTNRDKYGRLLRYVYTSDGTLINQIMIEQGFAYEYTYEIPYKFQKEFKSAEVSARSQKRGLWADGVCQQ